MWFGFGSGVLHSHHDDSRFLLKDFHPRFSECEEQGLFLYNDRGCSTSTVDTMGRGGVTTTSSRKREPLLAPYWSGGLAETSAGALLDFTNPDAAAWWRDQAREHLLRFGMDGIWNDNNEFEAAGTKGACCWNFDGQNHSVEVVGRPVLTMLMARASYEALLFRDEQGPDPDGEDHGAVGERGDGDNYTGILTSPDALSTKAPGHQKELAPSKIAPPNKKIPVVLTRSGCPGIQRYCCQSWSGDNLTAWATVKHNIPMGLSMGLSGFPFYGHDVGGFAGPAPDPDLFLRWVQNGVFYPRFCIHSWNEAEEPGLLDEELPGPPRANAVWMYPEILPNVRAALNFRYELIPYLWQLGCESCRTGAPVARPLAWEFFDDEESCGESFDYLLGRDLMVCGMFGCEERRVVRFPVCTVPAKQPV